MSSPAPEEEQGARADFFAQARRYTRYLGVTTREGRFVVATRSKGIGLHLFSKGARPEFRVLGRAVSVVEMLAGDDAIAGRLFVDIGASIGTEAISALVSHRFGSAVSCEPEEESHRLLRANVALNDLEDRVRPLRVAVSNRAGRGNLVATGEPGGKAWIAVDPGEIRGAEAARVRRAAEAGVPLEELPELTVREVELVTLDQLAEGDDIDPDRVGMLWIDAEGHEGHVLQGATTLTDRAVPVVFEFHPAGLDKHRGRDMVHEVAERRYTHFVDLRRQQPAQERFGLRPVAELSQLADHFLDPATSASYTDLLMLRLEPGQAGVGANLPNLVRRRMRQSAQERDR